MVGLPPYAVYMDITTILKAGTPIYATDPGASHTGINARAHRHVATVVRPMRDYGRNTASYYEVRLWDGRERVYSADYITPRHEGQDAHAWDASH